MPIWVERIQNVVMYKKNMREDFIFQVLKTFTNKICKGNQYIFKIKIKLKCE